MITSEPGAYCELNFTGTGISFISARRYDAGEIDVYINGVLKERIVTRANLGQSKKRVIYSINGLENKQHTIKIVAVNGTPSIDAFGILTKKATDSSAQVSKLIINGQWFYPSLHYGAYSGIPGKLSNGSEGSATIRLTDTDNLINNNLPTEEY